MVSLVRTLLLENKACSYCEYVHEDDKGVNCDRCYYQSHFNFNKAIRQELELLELTLLNQKITSTKE